jgi:lysophospholipase L1-like esterase
MPRRPLLSLCLPLFLVLGCDPDRLFLGDSITAANGYVEILAEELPHETIGRAACGATTSWQWTLETPAPGFHCALGLGASLYELFVEPWSGLQTVYILLGTNDSNFHAANWDGIPVHPDEYAQNLATLIENLQADGAHTVILIAPPDVQDDVPERNERLAQYRDRIRAMCLYFPGVFCGPDLSQILTEPGDFIDRLHPSARGHAKIAAALLNRPL